jgi:hypothetical protein
MPQNSHQMLSAITKQGLGFESGGASGGSGGQQIFGPNFNLGGGSNGSNMPGGPSYFEE